MQKPEVLAKEDVALGVMGYIAEPLCIDFVGLLGHI
jgi:hypothetical protein